MYLVTSYGERFSFNLAGVSFTHVSCCPALSIAREPSNPTYHWGKAAQGTQKHWTRYLETWEVKDRYWTQTPAELGHSRLTLQFWPTGPNFTSVVLWVPKYLSGKSLSLSTDFPRTKHPSYFHFQLRTIYPLSLSSPKLISPTCLCYAVVFILNLKARFSRLSQG